jgi:GntR family transcriptional repressor for pyruvate dehydrogenase complex
MSAKSGMSSDNPAIKKLSRQESEQSSALKRLAKEMGPIRTEDLTGNIVRQLKASILRGVIKPGEKLPPERELAALLQISRGSLRQALKALQVMGVLEVIHGSGAYLANAAGSILRDPTDLLIPLKGHSFAEMYEARRAMEAESAACAALRSTEEDIQKMRSEIDAMQKVLMNTRKFVERDKAFHRHIAMATGNSVFVWFIELLQKVLAKGQLTHARNERHHLINEEHVRIVNAIQARDPQLARTEMLAHLTLSKAYSNQETGIELRVFSPDR